MPNRDITADDVIRALAGASKRRAGHQTVVMTGFSPPGGDGGPTGGGPPSGGGGGGSGFANPMTASGSLIRGGVSGAPVELMGGVNGRILTMVAGLPAWTANAAMFNPMTGIGDTIYGMVSGVPTRLPIGTSGQVLQVVNVAGNLVPRWTTLSVTENNVVDNAGNPVISETGDFLTAVA